MLLRNRPEVRQVRAARFASSDAIGEFFCRCGRSSYARRRPEASRSVEAEEPSEVSGQSPAIAVLPLSDSISVTASLASGGGGTVASGTLSRGMAAGVSGQDQGAYASHRAIGRHSQLRTSALPDAGRSRHDRWQRGTRSRRWRQASVERPGRGSKRRSPRNRSPARGGLSGHLRLDQVVDPACGFHLCHVPRRVDDFDARIGQRLGMGHRNDRVLRAPDHLNGKG